MIFTSYLHPHTHLTDILQTGYTGLKYNQFALNKTKSRVIILLFCLGEHSHSLNGRHMLTFTSARDQ